MQHNVILEKVGRYKVGSTTLDDMLSKSPEVLSILAPKGSKRSKSSEVNLIATYMKVLQSVVEMDKVLTEFSDDAFVEISKPVSDTELASVDAV
eukprot:10698763-Karenia_brevis.AAC.1